MRMIHAARLHLVVVRPLPSTYRLLSILVSIVFLCGCAKTTRPDCGELKAVDYLLSYEDEELRTLDLNSKEGIAATADRIRGKSLSPAYVCRMRTDAESEPYVVYIELPFMDGYPGINRMSITVMDSTGFAVTPLAQREFSLGGRTKVVHCAVRHDPGIAGLTDLLVLDVIRGGPHQAEKGIDYYVLSDEDGSVPPRLFLLRREDAQGKALRLMFTHRWHDHGRLMDGVVPVYDKHISWRSVLEDGSLTQKLSALLFLNSHHDYVNNREYQHALESVPSYLVRTGVIDRLLKHDVGWVREYASMLAGQAQEVTTLKN